MRKQSKFVLALILITCALVAWNWHSPLATEKGGGPGGLDLKLGSEPIHVSAKTLEWDHKGHKATFHQEVVARQQDLEIHCDDLVIYFNENDDDVTRLVAKGNVRVMQQDRRASCEEAVYDRSNNRIVMEGNPVIRQGQNEVRGKRVIFYVGENRSVVEGGEGGRVKVTLIPEKEELGDQF
jgi:lipopolysaccharide export system protein LptA